MYALFSTLFILFRKIVLCTVMRTKHFLFLKLPVLILKKKHERKVVARIFAFSMYAQKSTFSDAPSYS